MSVPQVCARYITVSPCFQRWDWSPLRTSILPPRCVLPRAINQQVKTNGCTGQLLAHATLAARDTAQLAKMLVQKSSATHCVNDQMLCEEGFRIIFRVEDVKVSLHIGQRAAMKTRLLVCLTS